MNRTLPTVLSSVALAGLALFGAACGGDSGENGGPVPRALTAEAAIQAVHLQNRGIGLLERFDYGAAVEPLEKSFEMAPDWPVAKFHLALAYLHAGSETRLVSRVMMEAIVADDPTHVHALFAAGLLAENAGEPEAALPHFRSAYELSGDAVIGAKLGTLLSSLDREQEALEVLRGVHAGRPALVSPVNALMLLNRRVGNDELADEFYQKLLALKGAASEERQWVGAGEEMRDAYGNLGRYSLAIRDFGDPGTGEARPTGAVEVAHTQIPWSDGSQCGAAPPGAPAYLGLACFDYDADGDLDLFVCGGTAPSALLRNEGDLRFTDVAAEAGLQVTGAYAVTVGEIDVDPAKTTATKQPGATLVDLVVMLPDGLRVYRNRGDGTFEDATAATGLGADPGGGRALVLFDADQEGDLDLYVAGAAGATSRLWANKGPGVFVDATEASGLAGDGGAYGPAVVLDADEDFDLDLLVTRPDGPPTLYLNDRLLHFRAADGWIPPHASAPHGALVIDTQRDGHEDVVLFGETSAMLLAGTGTSFNALALPGTPGGPAVDVDPLLRGLRDLVFAAGVRAPATEPVGEEQTGLGNVESLFDGRDLTNILAADLDGDGAEELVLQVAGAQTAIVALEAEGRGNGLVLDFQGVIRNDVQAGWSNLEGRDALVGVKTGPFWQRTRIGRIGGYGVAAPTRTVFGVGTASQADFVSTQWPDAVQQGVLDVPVGAPYLIVEEQRRPDSCPLLFSWDGEKYAWVTDFIGAGGVGFLIAPGVYAQPDPTESVKVAAELVAPAEDGRLVFKLVEAMEEMVYLDGVELLAVDHPAGVTVHPNERFTGEPPFADGRLLASRDEILPVRARDARGRDVTPQVLSTDRQYTEEPDLHPRLTGAISESVLEIDFGDRLDAVSPGDPLVLYAHGWIEYGYTRTSVAASGEEFEYLPPILETWRADGEGGGAWHTVVPSLGYPAGFPRVMTYDVTGLVSRETPRLRIRTNFEIYWDRVWLARTVDPAVSLRTTTLRPESAVLRRIGYPREYSPDGGHPRIYDYQTLDRAMPWKTVEGDYTRFGDVRPLLLTADDMYVVYGKGEEIDARFDPSQLPDLPDGWVRSYVLNFTGWCKGQELYIAHGFTVEPLPFLGMSHYPYGADEHYPDDEEHRRYREEWNTRKVRALRR